MANSRIIRQNFFNDPQIAGKYDEKQRLLLIGLACASDDYGRFWWNPINLKSIIYPTDNKQGKWIEKNLELFYKDEILCKYSVNNIKYGHFPSWFDKGFCLKQLLNHPKENENPDCRTHKMNEKRPRKKQETSPPIKENLKESNLYEYKESVSDDINSLTQSFLDSLKSKFPKLNLISLKEKYILYYKSSPKDIKNHQAHFEKWCIDENGFSNKEEKVSPEEEMKKLNSYNKRMGTNYKSVEEFREATKDKY